MGAAVAYRGVRGTIVDVTEVAGDVPLVFSALDSSVAGPVEEDFARAGAMVVSNAKNHRMDTVVPLLVPEVNPEHLDLLAAQDYGGGIVTNPNCSTIGLTLALAPLHRAFGVRKVHVVTLQARTSLSAGSSPTCADSSLTCPGPDWFHMG